MLGGLQTIAHWTKRSSRKCCEGSRVKEAGAARVELDVLFSSRGGGGEGVGESGGVRRESRQSGKERAVITSANERQLRVSRCCRLTLTRRRV